MSKLIHLGDKGFNGWLLDAILRDPVHDFGDMSSTMTNQWLHGGGTYDTITTFKKMLIQIISQSTCEENDNGECKRDINENIDSSLLLKAYNSVVDDIIYDKIIYAFFIDLHGEGGDNTEFVDKTLYMKNPDAYPGHDAQLKTQVKTPQNRIPEFLYPDVDVVPADVVPADVVPADVDGDVDGSVPADVDGDVDGGVAIIEDDEDFGRGKPQKKRPRGPTHNSVAPGTVTYLIEILTLKKNANRLTHDDEEMLKLLENYTNYNYITNFYKKKNKLIYLLDNNTTLYKTPHNLMLIAKIKKATAKMTNYSDDYYNFYIFYDSIKEIIPPISPLIKNILDDFITTFMNFELFSYVIFSQQIKNDITIKINAPINMPVNIIPIISTNNGSKTGPAESTGLDIPPIIGKRNFDSYNRIEVGGSCVNNVNYKGGNQPNSKYNLYVNTVRKIIGGYSNIQSGGTHAGNWLKMLKCFAFNLMGIQHNNNGELTPAPGAETNYHSYLNIPALQLNTPEAYNNIEWFDFEKSSLSLKYGTKHIEDDVIKYIVGRFNVPNFNVPAPANIITIDDLTQVKIGLLDDTNPDEHIEKQDEKYIKRNTNSINNVKFPIYNTSVFNADLFKLLANTFVNNPPSVIPADIYSNYEMKYIINNECNQLEKKDANPAKVFTNNSAPNVLTNYPSYADPGASGSTSSIIVDEFGIYHMGFCGNNNNNIYALHLNPATTSHSLTIKSTVTAGSANAGTATYNFSRTPENFGTTMWGGTTGVTANRCIACAVEFLEKYMGAAVSRSYPNGKIPATWKSLNFLCSDFGRITGQGTAAHVTGPNRYNRNYPKIPDNINFDDVINNTNFQQITGNAASLWKRLPAFFIFYTYLLFKGTGDISQEMTSLIKFGGIIPSAGQTTPNTPKRSTDSTNIVQKFAINNTPPNMSSSNPLYVRFDRNGNAPRMLLSHDRPSGARFILTMHYGIKYLRTDANAALKLAQNNINMFAFGGYIGNMRNIIFAKVNQPLFFGTGPTAAITAAITNSTKTQIPLTNVFPAAPAAIAAATYGGKKQRRSTRKYATKKTRKNKLTKRKNKLTKRKHKVTKRKHKVTKRKHKVTKRKHKVTKRKHK
jgi:hypothetical protein